MTIRDAQRRDWPAVLALNEAWVHYLSPMDEAQLAAFAAAAGYFRVIEHAGAVAGFLLAFRKGDDYGGAVFRRFCAERDDFFYIDRVVVEESARKLGLAKRLYDDLAVAARAAGVPRLTCEVNVEPPNAGSLAFHRRYGFRETGRAPHNGKAVALLELDLTA